MHLADKDVISILDIIKYIGDGSDYDRGQLEELSASIEIIKRIAVYTALKSGVTVRELLDLHNGVLKHEEMLAKTKPVFPGFENDYKDL